MKKLVNTSLFYAVLALAGGVFYREFTKFHSVSGGRLAFVHLHLFTLGMLMFLLLALFQDRLKLVEARSFRPAYWLYNAGVLVMTAGLVWRGVCDTLSLELSRGVDAAVSGLSGIGHILLAAGLVLLLLILRKRAGKR